MFFTEALAMIVMSVVFCTAVAAMTNMVLSHRREMTRIKFGGDNRESSDVRLENEELKETVGLLQDRLAVLEQIATDPARRTAEEIERLR